MVPNWAIEHSDLTLHELAVYIVLLKHRDQEGKCWPGFATIADQARVSRDTVKRTTKSLESRGLIQIERRKVGGKNLPNVYTVGLVYSGTGTAKGARVPRRRISNAGVTGRQGVGAGSTYLGAGSTHGRRSEHPELYPENQTHEPDEVRRSATKHHDEQKNDESAGSSSQHGASVEAAMQQASPVFEVDLRSTPLTSRTQITYLSDLHILNGDGVPAAELLQEWRACSPSKASELIDEYQREIGRGVGYTGPHDDDPEYDQLSERGKSFADAYMLPQEVKP